MLNWLLSPQIHKSTHGYYLNHDNLVLAGDEDRKKLIFYFIASQTPEKLDPQDYEEFRIQQIGVVEFGSATTSLILGGYLASKMGRLGLLQINLRQNPILNFGFIALTGFVSFAFSYQLGHALFEPKFVSQNQVLAQLSQKYNFTVFDFALAKKESHLKHLRSELSSDSEGITHF